MGIGHKKNQIFFSNRLLLAFNDFFNTDNQDINNGSM
jgi:hypothetical protein